MSDGFALQEYVVPKTNGIEKPVVGGTMPKAPIDQGGMLYEVKKSSKNPGPEHYNRDCLNASFSDKTRGGTFSKLTREYAKSSLKTPAVGHYETVTPQCTPRTMGGVLPKTTRGCMFIDTAVNQSKFKQAPGKYDGKLPPPHMKCPSFSTGTATESRSPKKPSLVGPGYYASDYKLVTKRSLAYGASKGELTSFVDQYLKIKDKIPAPGHNGIGEAKNEDRSGKRKHADKILSDKQQTPRVPSTGEQTPQSAPTPRGPLTPLAPPTPRTQSISD